MLTLSCTTLTVTEIIRAALAAPVRPVTSLRELVQDNIATFGHYDAAKIVKKKMCFTHFYYLAFGRLPRAMSTI